MNLEEIRTGADLREYIIELLAQKDKEAANGEYIYPPLLDYLLSLWTVAEQYKSNELLTFRLLARILEQAFIAPKKQVDWDELEKNPFIIPYQSNVNTPEYFEEIKKYGAFEKELRNYVISLKMLLTYGAEKLGVKPYDNIFTGNRFFWENTTTEKFLERGTVYLEDDTDLENIIDWSDFQMILNNGRFEE